MEYLNEGIGEIVCPNCKGIDSPHCNECGGSGSLRQDIELDFDTQELVTVLEMFAGVNVIEIPNL